MSEKNNPYWNGDEHAWLRPEDINERKWRPAMGAIDVANRAFCIWYHGRKFIYETDNDKHRKQMTHVIEDCGTDGKGRGSADDLQEVLNHYDKNGEEWDNADTANYFGGQGLSHRRTMTEVPKGCAEFLSSVDKKVLPKLSKAMRKFQTHSMELRRLARLPETEAHARQIESSLTTIKKSAEKIKPVAWLVPPKMEVSVPWMAPPDGMTTLATIGQYAGAVAGGSGGMRTKFKILSLVDTIETIKTSIGIYLSVRNKNFAISIAALNFATSFLPVLGGFYSEIIGRIPELEAKFKAGVESYHNKRFEPVAYLSQRDKAPRVWRCDICGSSGGYTK